MCKRFIRCLYNIFFYYLSLIFCTIFHSIHIKVRKIYEKLAKNYLFEKKYKERKENVRLYGMFIEI